MPRDPFDRMTALLMRTIGTLIRTRAQARDSDAAPANARDAADDLTGAASGRTAEPDARKYAPRFSLSGEALSETTRLRSLRLSEKTHSLSE